MVTSTEHSPRPAPPLRVLQVEDSESDAALVLRVLRRNGYELSTERVEDAEGMRRALESSEWDVIISDYSLPGFGAAAALQLLHESGRDIPFIVVSGAMGEDTAVAMMKRGAHDYVMKGNLARLAPAVEREIKEARIRVQRRAAEAALQAGQAKLNCVVESVLDGVVMMDARGRISLWNSAAERMFGFTAQEALGTPLHDMVLPADLQEPALKGLSSFEQSGKGYVVGRLVELTARHRNGTTFPVELSVAPVQIEGTWHAVGVVRDVTERKKAEEALRQSEQRWQFALEGAGDGVWDWDIENGHVYVSRQWKAMLGYGEDEAAGQVEDWGSWIHSEDRDRVLQEVARHLDRHSSIYVSEHRIRCKDGSLRWVLDRGRVIHRDAGGKPLRMIGTHSDITERKRAEEEKTRLQAQFLQSQKMESVGRLAGGVAHDLNNLLTVINGYSELVLGNLSPDALELRDSLAEIRSAGDRAAGLVRQLLAFSRQQMLHPQVVDVNNAIAEMEKLVLRLIGEDVEIVTKVRPGLHSVVADRHQLEQVLLNLVVNARDAMPGGGTLTIETDESWQEGFCSQCQAEVKPGLYVQLIVRDTGVGMDAETQQHVFEPFYTTKPVRKGTGLRLTTVQGIVLQSGGHVSFESTTGEGTTFRVSLPAVDQPAPDQPDSPAMVKGGTEVVVLVEDQVEVRKLTARLLTGYGYRVLECTGPDEALNLLATQDADVLLTDVVMPRMNGRELASRARKLRPHLRVLFMSGYSGEVLSNPEDHAPDGPFLQKPFTPKALAAAVQEVLQLKVPAHILVVDDEAAVRRLLRSILEKAGFRVGEVGDGQQAMRYLESSRADLIMMDLVMPEQEGLETIRAARRVYPSVKIIAMSGAGGGTYLGIAKLMGADAVLAKPLNPETLVSEARRLLESGR